MKACWEDGKMGQSSLLKKHDCWVCCSAATWRPGLVLHLHKVLGQWPQKIYLNRNLINCKNTEFCYKKYCCTDEQCSTCCFKINPLDKSSFFQHTEHVTPSEALCLLQYTVHHLTILSKRVWWNLFLFFCLFIFSNFAEASYQNESHTQTPASLKNGKCYSEQHTQPTCSLCIFKQTEEGWANALYLEWWRYANLSTNMRGKLSDALESCIFNNVSETAF